MTPFWHNLKTVARLLLRRPLAGTRVIPILPDGRIVLVRNRASGRWNLPGGLIEWGESVADDARRELAEETGLELMEVERLVGVYSNVGPRATVHGVYIALAARVRGEPRVRERAEVREVRAFAREELPLGEMTHVHAQPLRDYLEGRTRVA